MSFTLYHGTNGDNILQIIAVGTMSPNASREIFFSEQYEDVLQHGADRKRRESYALKLEVTLPIGASQSRTTRFGNQRTVIVTTPMPVRVQVLEMYIRVLGQPGPRVVKGIQAIKAYLQKP